MRYWLRVAMATRSSYVLRERVPPTHSHSAHADAHAHALRTRTRMRTRTQTQKDADDADERTRRTCVEFGAKSDIICLGYFSDCDALY